MSVLKNISRFIKQSNITSISKKTIKIILFLLFIFISSACHSKYIKLSNDICKFPVFNKNKTKIVFLSLINAYRKPEGVSKFPDGGKYKAEYSNLVLYTYDIKTKQLNKIKEFNELIDKDYLPYRNTYRIKLIFDDNFIKYSISLSNWHNINKSIQKKYSHTYSINLNTKKIKKIDDINFINKYKKIENSTYISLSDLNKILSNITCMDWGINLNNIFPQSTDNYKDYIVYAKGNSFTLKCVSEQILPTLKQNEIKNIISEMTKYQNKLFKEYENNNDSPYQKALKKEKYEDYKIYFERIKKIVVQIK
jgi:hypothetical protein